MFQFCIKSVTYSVCFSNNSLLLVLHAEHHIMKVTRAWVGLSHIGKETPCGDIHRIRYFGYDFL